MEYKPPASTAILPLSWLELVALGWPRTQFGTHLGYFEGISEVFRERLNLRKGFKDAGFKLACQPKPEAKNGCAGRSPKGEGWCRGAELNRRHTDFQSVALPTELPRHSSLLPC